MEFKFAVFNGKIIPKEKAVIPIDHKGYFFDFAVYSSLKIVQGKVFFPEYHIERLFESAEFIDLRHGFKRAEVKEWIDLLIKKNNLKDALLRLLLIGDADENKKAELYIFPVGGLTFYPDRLYSKGAKVITWQAQRFFPKSKTKNLLESFLALREAQKHGAIDALMVDSDGNIREGTRSNFFAIKGSTIITPPKEKVLEGITKKILLETAKEKFSIKEEDIPISKIKEYDELFISSTSMNIMPINQIDETKINSGFEKTRILQKLFKEYYDKKVFGKK